MTDSNNNNDDSNKKKRKDPPKPQVQTVTDSMDVDTPKDSFTPEGSEWYRIKTNLDETIDFNEIDRTQPLLTAMLCAVCNDFQNQCFYDGVCNDFGSGKHAGALCELDAGAKVENLEEIDVGE